MKVQRMTYEEASVALEEGGGDLERMEEVADRFRDVREAGGALGFNFPDVAVKVSTDSACCSFFLHFFSIFFSVSVLFFGVRPRGAQSGLQTAGMLGQACVRDGRTLLVW